MLVLDDIVLLWTGEGAMATQTDHRQPVKQSIFTQLLFLLVVRHGWITELPSSMRPAMPLLFSLYLSHTGHLLILHRVNAAARKCEMQVNQTAWVYRVSSGYGL